MFKKYRNVIAKTDKLLVLTILAFVFLLFYQLGSDIFNADAHFWYQRTLDFSEAALKGDFAKTYQNAKPGVTVMWLSGIPLHLFLNTYEKVRGFRPYIFGQGSFDLIHFVVKAPLVTLGLISAGFLYYFASKIWNKSFALLCLILLVFQPYFLFVLRIFHADGALVSFMSVAALSLIYYLSHENKSSKYLYISAIATGMAFLTKTQAIFLYPFGGLIFLFNRVFFKEETMVFYVKKYLVWVFVSILTIFTFFPALWVNPRYVLTDMFKEAFVVAEEGRNTTGGDNLPYIKQLIPDPANRRMFSIYNLVLFPAGVFLFIKNYKRMRKSEAKVLAYSFLFIFFYFCQMFLVYQKSLRYLAPAYFFISIIAAYGLYSVVRNWSSRGKNILAGGLLAVSFAGAFYYAPHYSTVVERNTTWGELAIEAARYLNEKPDAALMKVAVEPKFHTFRPFFKGESFDSQETLANGKVVDYVVVSTETTIDPRYKCDFEKDIVFRGKIFWKIYRCK